MPAGGVDTAGVTYLSSASESGLNGHLEADLNEKAASVGGLGNLVPAQAAYGNPAGWNSAAYHRPAVR